MGNVDKIKRGEPVTDPDRHIFREDDGRRLITSTLAAPGARFFQHAH